MLILLFANLTVAQPTLLGKVSEVYDAVKELKEEKLLMKKAQQYLQQHFQ